MVSIKIYILITSVLLSNITSSQDTHKKEHTLKENGTCWIQTACKTSPPQNKAQPTNSRLNTYSSNPNCYPWMFRNETNGECKCSDIPNRAVHCDLTIPRTSLQDCYCMTFDMESNETVLGQCLYGCSHPKFTKYFYQFRELPKSPLDLNKFSCGNFHRDSPLCGRCKPGYSPLVYSYDMSCMNCTGMTYNWIKYIAVAYIPLTVFFFFVVVFSFSGTSPLVRSFIALCQGLTAPISMRPYLIIAKRNYYTEIMLKIFGTMYGIWNLDFFRIIVPPICLEISPLQALSLDYAVAFYPLLLVILTYILISLHSRDVRLVVWLWKPFRKVFLSIRKDWDMEGSIVKAFATFFMLSYLKIVTVTADLLVYTKMYTLGFNEKRYHVKLTLFSDASVEYFRGTHFYYGIVATLVGIFTVLLPLVFLVMYPMR